MSEPILIDATEIYCPSFTSPVMGLIRKQARLGDTVIVKTLEERSEARIKHLCASFNWEYMQSCLDSGIYFHVLKRTNLD